MLIERDVVPAFRVYLYCKGLPNTAQAQSPESSALLLHTGAERIEYMHQIINGRDYAEDVFKARLF